MKRKPETIEAWNDEVIYIMSIQRLVDASEGENDPGPVFNHDLKCFERYCRMQAQLCDADGYPELAYLMWSEAF